MRISIERKPALKAAGMTAIGMFLIGVWGYGIEFVMNDQGVVTGRVTQMVFDWALTFWTANAFCALIALIRRNAVEGALPAAFGLPTSVLAYLMGDLSTKGVSICLVFGSMLVFFLMSYFFFEEQEGWNRKRTRR